MTSDPTETAPRLWWRIKVGAGAALIALLCAHYLLGLPQVTLDIPRWLAQALVLTGGITTLLHHRIVAGACAGNQPARLVDSGGLYGWVRHPMYLGDCLLYVGMGLLVPHPLSTLLVAIGCTALVLQARAEDVHMAALFGEPFRCWQQRSGLLLPGL
jgi:protein-S-isoprenylcysteine O-methyltransferase Ste14